MSHRSSIIIAGLAVATAIIMGLFIFRKPVVAPTTNTVNGNRAIAPTNSTSPTETTVFSTADLPDRDSHFSFAVNMPSSWAVEYVADSQAISFFDPAAAGSASLTKSQVFVQYYQGADWQPSTYSHKSKDATVGGQPARDYRYEVPDNVRFSLAPGYPAWVVTQAHGLVHIRTGAQTPYIYYIFHQAPDLPASIFSDIINSLRFTN